MHVTHTCHGGLAQSLCKCTSSTETLQRTFYRILHEPKPGYFWITLHHGNTRCYDTGAFNRPVRRRVAPWMLLRPAHEAC